MTVSCCSLPGEIFAAVLCAMRCRCRCCRCRCRCCCCRCLLGNGSVASFTLLCCFAAFLVGHCFGPFHSTPVVFVCRLSIVVCRLSASPACDACGVCVLSLTSAGAAGFCLPAFRAFDRCWYERRLHSSTSRFTYLRPPVSSNYSPLVKWQLQSVCWI